MIRVTHSIKTPDSADEISNTPSGTISSTNVQDALNELDGDVVALDASLGTAAVEDVGSSGHTLPFLDGANTWASAQAYDNGISFGNQVGSSAADLSKHIDLYAGGYGFSITGSSFNYIAGIGATHNFYSGSTNTASLSSAGQLNTAAGIIAGSSVTASGGSVRSQGATNGIVFDDRTGGGDLWQWYSTSNIARLWYSTGADHLRMNPSGSLELVFGQLNFPDSQNASADANTLDDYEEGTFTPTFSSSGATFSYTTQQGIYTKVGNLVTYSVSITLATSGNTLTASPVTISGLPFTAIGSGNPPMQAVVHYANSTTSYVEVSARILAGGTVISLVGATAASTANITALNSNALLHATNGSIVRVTGSYWTA